MKSLAIEREFGSGGREIGKRVAEKAGISCYDGSLIAQVAESKGLSLDMLKEYDEKRTGSVLYNIGLLASYNYNRNNSQAVELYYELQNTIKALEMQGPAVFIGRSSTEILRDNPRTVRVFIYSSDMDKRIDRIVRTENVTPEQAKKMAALSDGVIVGSAIIKLLEKYGKDAPDHIGAYVKAMKDSLKSKPL